MDTHIKVLGFLYIIAGAILVVLGLMLFGIIGGSGLISGDRQAMFVTGIVGTALAVFFVILSIPSIIAGIGLLNHREWARILTIILGIFHLFGFPIGTALGVYTLYVLLNEQTKPLFA
ncbi:MAG TPA: hypothetical protein VH087_12570 [Thermoanaerobaculia bacterium]|nr:hypothetical protein [Thermoanaerobaculia bacterium]